MIISYVIHMSTLCFIISQDGGETEEETGLEETHQHVHKEKVKMIMMSSD